MREVKTVRVEGLKKTTYTLRLYFTEPKFQQINQRMMKVVINGTTVEEKLDIIKEVGTPMQSLVKEYTQIKSEGKLKIQLAALNGKSTLSGIELIADGLKKAPLQQIEPLRQGLHSVKTSEQSHLETEYRAETGSLEN